MTSDALQKFEGKEKEGNLIVRGKKSGGSVSQTEIKIKFR